MVFLLRRTSAFSIRLATLFGLPCTLYAIGVNPSVFCPSIRTDNFRHISTSCSLYKTMASSAALHVRARSTQYPGSTVARFPVPDDKVDWSVKWAEYKPISYTAPTVLKNPEWADPDIGSFSPKFNALDGAVDRTSFDGIYRVENEVPLNPQGRTGLSGRGLLGRWGPNHAADPIVTRWKVDGSGAKIRHSVSKQPILQFVSIMRKDCGEWAIPGGMVDPGEQVSLTLQREFSEEALNSLTVPPSDREKIYERITKLFSSNGSQVYKGYVDDPRNTDNAWMETVAVNFHDELGDSVSELPLQAGDDAGQVKWVDLDSSLDLYANHSHFLEMVAKERKAHW
ncbi:ADP-ribose pyrophosphatase, mitochondrial [Oryzias melastigma]|uniref:ADP-ribose pyrophosphatase, mitochondrial n=1 Tax=Oryzias melastigma TaxID=30732 RepID=A0A834FI33_ORYME|nr:ADP-ribose pyrophosphatase, mitochondrial [Oryzias melastigma]